ncbi:MAG TPA: (Fe-S)-binding protein [Deltaproteobacteria bacterium]|nr:(Fe-S)-binding protein [Deltaproteobacteria bacterium]
MPERKPVFKRDLCNECGECLHRCPVMELPLEKAKEEVAALINGEDSHYALSRCTSCMSCNLYCPTGANPYSLIQHRWNDRYTKKGAPPLYRFVCPTLEPNIWQLLNVLITQQERRWISQWMDTIPQIDDEVLLVGNYIHLFPFIIGDSALLNHFKPIDRLDQWEGGAYLYQGGYLDLVQQIALRCKSDFDTWGVKTVVPLLDAVYYIFTKVHPDEMGVEHKPKFINFHDWLLEKIDSGTIPLTKKLGLTLTVHDNCYSKPFGDELWDKHRELLSRCGCSIVEMRHNRKDSLCCGFGKGASWTKNISLPYEIIAEGAKKFKEAEETGADALVSYCGGCIYLLWAARELLGSPIDVYHSLEIVRMAMGEQINYPRDHIRRAWDVIAIITYQWIISLFQKNFVIEKITFDESRDSFQPKKHRGLIIIRRLFDIPLVRRSYAFMFRLLMPLMSRKNPAAVR